MPARPSVRSCAAACLLAASVAFVAVGHSGEKSSAPRRPVAAAHLGNGQRLCVANRIGSMSVVDLDRGQSVAEVAVGQRLSGLAALPDRRHVLAVDEQRHELVALVDDGTTLRVRTRLAVGPYPVSVAVQEDGRRATVAGLWSRRVDVVDLTPLATSAGPVRLRVLHSVGLPLAPREQCLLPGGARVVVADSFGGRLAVVDAAAGRLVRVHQLTGNNLRGLAVSPDGNSLLVSHQVISQSAAMTRETLDGGERVTNVLRSIPLKVLGTARADLDGVGHLMKLNRPGQGAGDPAGIAALNEGEVAVALAGVNEVAFVRADGPPDSFRRVVVGRRPTGVLARGPGQPVVVLNTFDDSLSVLDAQRGAVTNTIALGPPPRRLDPKERGELLFFDARLGRGGLLSCHSCHTDGHTNGQLADTLSDNTYGTPKRVLTLMNTALTDPWAWNGQVKDLDDQVHKSLVQTMHAGAVTGEQVHDLVSFLHTLPPPPPPEPATDDPADRAHVERGRRVFHERGCVRCHIAPLTYTSPGAAGVGLADERGLKKFNPPSLRGVGQGYGFFHDNRAATLEEVFTTHGHPDGTGPPADELDDLLRFLRSL